MSIYSVVQLRKLLREKNLNLAEGESIDLYEKQVEHLKVTVPCVKFGRSNSSFYYFVDAGICMGVDYHGSTSGRLYRMTPDDPKLFYEDGTRRYVADESGVPEVFSYAGHDLKLRIRIEELEQQLWLARKPYRVKIDGYESRHKSGVPKSDYGYSKTLKIQEDYESCYLSIEPISHDRMQEALDVAISSGEFKEGMSVAEFKEGIYRKESLKRSQIETRYEFQRFVKEGAVEQHDKAVDAFNETIDHIDTFMDIARQLKKLVKENPSSFIRQSKTDTTLKHSQMFRSMKEIQALKAQRYSLLNEGDGTSRRLGWILEAAVKEANV